MIGGLFTFNPIMGIFGPLPICIVGLIRIFGGVFAFFSERVTVFFKHLGQKGGMKIVNHECLQLEQVLSDAGFFSNFGRSNMI